MRSTLLFRSFGLSIEQAAKQSKKWLLVNIQADGEFDCHRLNRDLWKDEMVQSIVECNCVFWQVFAFLVLWGHHGSLLVCVLRVIVVRAGVALLLINESISSVELRASQS